MKKVIIDLLKLSNLNCGLGQVAYNFGKQLALEQTKFEKHFIIPDSFQTRFEGTSCYFHTKSQIQPLLKSNYFDLLHCIHQDPTIIPDNGIPILMTIHDLNFLEEKNAFKSKRRLKSLQKRVDKCKHLSFISEFSKSVSLKNIRSTLETTVIYNGVNTIENEKELGGINSEFFFTIGVLKSKKNFHTLIPIMKFFPEFKLVIAGDTSGTYYKSMQKMVNREKLDSRIIFTGTISEEEKTWLYRNCKAFLFPSLYEGFGLPIIEAMRNGVPVVASKLSSLPEIGSTHAYYFDSFDTENMVLTVNQSLADFAQNPDKKKNQIDYANGFSWKRNVREYVNLYDMLLGSG